MNAPVYRFLDVEVLPAARLIRRAGQPLALGPRAFDLLVVLIERRDRVVSKNELLDRVWPGLVVEENNLQVQISGIRKLLGVPAIATVPGRGYRFVLPLVDAPAAAAAPVPLPADEALIGRADDLQALQALWRQHRCVTLVGAVGSGKTHLARVLLQQFAPASGLPAVWVELGGGQAADGAAGAIAQALGVPAGGDATPARLLSALRERPVALVLDGAETQRDALAPLAAALRTGAPGLRLLMTSRMPLKLADERVYQLGPLALPPPGCSVPQAASCGAVALFVDRAQAADHRFTLNPGNVDAVVTVCRRLDGMPLALRLAAARLGRLGLAGLLARLDQALRLLGDAPPEHGARTQTLRAALEWSHQLLGAPEQAVFRRLAVCAGGFSLPLAAALAADAQSDEWAVMDHLASLVDHSLVAMEPGDPPRYRLLETVRQFARLKLDEAGETAALQARHLQVLTGLCDAAYDAYWAQPDMPWLRTWAPELDNVRTALDWGQAQRDPRAVGLLGATGQLFMLLGHAGEARRRADALADLAVSPASGTGQDPRDPLRQAARFWLECSRLHWGVSAARLAEQAARACALAEAADDARLLYLALRCAANDASLAPAAALGLIERMAALERPDWPPRLRAQRLLAKAAVLGAQRDWPAARLTWQSLQTLAHAAGLDGIEAAAWAGLAATYLAQGDSAQARASARTLRDDPRLQTSTFQLQARAALLQAALQDGMLAEAEAEAVALLQALRARAWEWLPALVGLFALLALRQQRPEAAARLLGYREACTARTGAPGGLGEGLLQTVSAALDEQLDGQLGGAAQRQLRAEGALLDEEAVSRLALGPAADPGSPGARLP